MKSSQMKKLLALPIHLCIGVGLTSGMWLAQATIAPLVAQAYTARMTLMLEYRFDETYETLLRRAEAIARAAAQRSFDQDILVTDVAVSVLGESEGATLPILTLEVTRPQWRSRPDTRYWATYFRSARTLLDLTRQQNGGAPAQPVPSRPTAPTAPANTTPTEPPDSTNPIPSPDEQSNPDEQVPNNPVVPPIPRQRG
ncbi:MAG: hypothetical protein KME16_11275 [Scytolyngbya sp. HA4215-MV1]|nr:hypothetical protein [Scytolyngbya sp. HA4215-MV1]